MVTRKKALKKKIKKKKNKLPIYQKILPTAWAGAGYIVELPYGKEHAKEVYKTVKSTIEENIREERAKMKKLTPTGKVKRKLVR